METNSKVRISVHSWFSEVQVKDLTEEEREALAVNLAEKYGKEVEFY